MGPYRLYSAGEENGGVKGSKEIPVGLGKPSWIDTQGKGETRKYLPASFLRARKIHHEQSTTPSDTSRLLERLACTISYLELLRPWDRDTSLDLFYSCNIPLKYPGDYVHHYYCLLFFPLIIDLPSAHRNFGTWLYPPTPSPSEVPS